MYGADPIANSTVRSVTRAGSVQKPKLSAIASTTTGAPTRSVTSTAGRSRAPISRSSIAATSTISGVSASRVKNSPIHAGRMPATFASGFRWCRNRRVGRSPVPYGSPERKVTAHRPAGRAAA
ncbi:hypothetical protein O159_24940 [Leifsonia xyli subsp. cynodontis DSM 46306]|uniref:Uncharacterized protein n=1 Tax=Leifsonia xyli subsp. cynodontis DSM 46306 TaxID=1389489 RepID=U3P825_LEIXC|nr:hypothetical protein O159_24940 [Leifsonia xyli subsp. cynodontis DSM 46306]